MYGEKFIKLLTLSRPRIGLESLLEHFIFLNFQGEHPTNSPQGQVDAHKYSHHTISNSRFTNPVSTPGMTAL